MATGVTCHEAGEVVLATRDRLVHPTRGQRSTAGDFLLFSAFVVDLGGEDAETSRGQVGDETQYGQDSVDTFSGRAALYRRSFADRSPLG
jgi:hypothetical protein